MQDLRIKDDIAELKVENRDGRSMGSTIVSINGFEVDCRSVEYRASVDGIPTCTIELLAIGDVAVKNAAIRFSYTPKTIVDAVRILQAELYKRNEIYDAFVASIESAIKDIGLQTLPFQSTREAAERILERAAFGEEL